MALSVYSNTSLVYDANLGLNLVPEMTNFLIAASFFLIALTVDSPKLRFGGTEKRRLVVAQDLMDTINIEPSFLRLLAVPNNENAINRLLFSERRGDKTKHNGRVEHHSKRSPPEIFLAVKGMLG
ncbi:hypothetical protein TNCV_230301 [Trichonephila clavipes]|nr:hypothetical protein TNCV_230301 [Trichonephila clavipes]